MSHGFRQKISPSVQPEVAALIRRCWAADPASRPSMSEVAAALQALQDPLPLGEWLGAVFFVIERKRLACASPLPTAETMLLQVHRWLIRKVLSSCLPASLSPPAEDTPIKELATTECCIIM